MGRSRRREFLRGFLASVAVALTLLAANQASPDQRPEISVATAAELIDALKPEQGARRIRMRAGRYTLAAPLSVPDGFELTGESVMQLDPGGLPAGFVAGTETALVAGEQLHGDVVTLGDGTLLHGLRIEGRALGPAQGGAATGNIVMIASRRPGDQLSATLRECEIVNHSGAGFNSIGPTGRAIVVMTRPRAAGAAWHQGAQVSAAIERSIVRNTSGGNAVFAINFAGGGAIALDFEHNRFEESLAVSGGAGRPHKVTGANVTLRSRGNLYVSAGGSFPVGWGILGGSSAPHEPLTEGAESNSVRIESHDDRIEGYRIGINAAGGRQIAGMPGTVKHNRSELLLSGLRIKTVGDGAADLVLHGAWLETEPGASAAALNSSRRTTCCRSPSRIPRVAGAGRTSTRTVGRQSLRRSELCNIPTASSSRAPERFFSSPTRRSIRPRTSGYFPARQGRPYRASLSRALLRGTAGQTRCRGAITFHLVSRPRS